MPLSKLAASCVLISMVHIRSPDPERIRFTDEGIDVVYPSAEVAPLFGPSLGPLAHDCEHDCPSCPDCAECLEVDCKEPAAVDGLIAAAAALLGVYAADKSRTVVGKPLQLEDRTPGSLNVKMDPELLCLVNRGQFWEEVLIVSSVDRRSWLCEVRARVGQDKKHYLALVAFKPGSFRVC